MKEIIIIGNGPAGISTALYTTRANIKTTIIGKDAGALEKAEKIENYYGFENPIHGKELVSIGIAQAKRLGAIYVHDEVVGIGYDNKLTVKTPKNKYLADSIVIATGVGRAKPPIKNIDEFEGKGISYCATCDAFFYKGKDVAVLGCCEYAISEANELLPIVKSVTMVTNGTKPITGIPKEIKVITTEIKAFKGRELLEGIEFTDGNSIEVSGAFIAIGVAGSSELAKKMGVATDGKRIIVDEFMSTNIPGIFAAGDCTGGLLQISKAVYEGTIAGTEAIKYIRKHS